MATSQTQEFLASMKRGKIGQHYVPAEAGVQARWDLSGATDPYKLQKGLDKVGMDATVMPRTKEASLKAALNAVYPYRIGSIVPSLSKHRRLVRALRDKETNGYTVVAEHPRLATNEYPTVASFRLSEYETVMLVTDEKGKEVDNYSTAHGVLGELQRQYEFFRNTLTPSGVGKLLAEIITKKLTPPGISLREKGVLYHIPIESAKLWRAVGDAAEEANVDPKRSSFVYSDPMVFSERSIRGAHEQLQYQIQLEREALDTELNKGEAGKRRLSTMSKELGALKTKATYYADLLGEFGDEMQDEMNKLDSKIVDAMSEQDLAAYGDDFKDVL